MRGALQGTLNQLDLESPERYGNREKYIHTGVVDTMMSGSNQRNEFKHAMHRPNIFRSYLVLTYSSVLVALCRCNLVHSSFLTGPITVVTTCVNSSSDSCTRTIRMQMKFPEWYKNFQMSELIEAGLVLILTYLITSHTAFYYIFYCRVSPL